MMLNRSVAPTMTHTMAKLLIAILLILFSPLLLPLFIVVAILACIVGCCHWLGFLVFCFTHLDSLYLVCSRRRGWEPFLVNNLIPVLPVQVKAIWIESPGTQKHLLRALRRQRSVTSVPFLALVTPMGLQCKSLNRPLVEKKQQGKASRMTQDVLLPFIEKAVQEFLLHYVRRSRRTQALQRAS